MEAQLCKACVEGQMDVIDSLLEAGVDVNVPDDYLSRYSMHVKPQALGHWM